MRSIRPCSKFIGSLGLIGRGLAAPPGTPKGAIAVMQTAWEKMVKDPKFLSDAQETKAAGDRRRRSDHPERSSTSRSPIRSADVVKQAPSSLYEGAAKQTLNLR